MKNRIRDIRRARGFSQAAVAEHAGVSIPQVSKWEAGKVNIPASKLVSLATLFGVDLDELIEGETPPEANATPFRMEGASAVRMHEDLPIYGSALGASRQIDGEAIEQTTLNKAEILHYAKRPVLLEGNARAYGLYVAGSSMDPRYRDGDVILADPAGRLRAGDDVVVYLRASNPEEDDGETARAALVKRLVRRAADYLELEQYSPAKTFRIDASDVVRVDRVIPWQELLG